LNVLIGGASLPMRLERGARTIRTIIRGYCPVSYIWDGITEVCSAGGRRVVRGLHLLQLLDPAAAGDGDIGSVERI
jgi:hypothetical protein